MYTQHFLNGLQISPHATATDMMNSRMVTADHQLCVEAKLRDWKRSEP